MDDRKNKGGRPRKDSAKRRGPAKKPRGKRKPMDDDKRTAIIQASAFVRTVPQAVKSLMDLAESSAANWRKLDDVAMHFAELAVSLSLNVDKPGEALFCAEKALAIREKYEALREAHTQAADNVGVFIEYSDVAEVCKTTPLTVIDGKSTASA